MLSCVARRLSPLRESNLKAGGSVPNGHSPHKAGHGSSPLGNQARPRTASMDAQAHLPTLRDRHTKGHRSPSALTSKLKTWTLRPPWPASPATQAARSPPRQPEPGGSLPLCCTSSATPLPPRRPRKLTITKGLRTTQRRSRSPDHLGPTYQAQGCGLVPAPRPTVTRLFAIFFSQAAFFFIASPLTFSFAFFASPPSLSTRTSPLPTRILAYCRYAVPVPRVNSPRFRLTAR